MAELVKLADEKVAAVIEKRRIEAEAELKAAADAAAAEKALEPVKEEE